MRIYAVNISDIDMELLEDKCKSVVEPGKLHKIKRFVNKQDKARTLVGELLIKFVVKEYLNINERLFMEKNEYGKPYFVNKPDIEFNISHSGDFVVCAIDGKPLGIDIEKIKLLEYKGLVDMFFANEEAEYILNESELKSLNRFYEIWTLKESYIKCCGRGLSIDLKSFSISMGEKINLISCDYGEKYNFRIINMHNDYKLSICSLNEEINDNIIYLNSIDLLW